MSEFRVQAHEVSGKNFQSFNIDSRDGTFRFLDQDLYWHTLECSNCENIHFDIGIVDIDKPELIGQMFRVICHNCGTMSLMVNMIPQQKS